MTQQNKTEIVITALNRTQQAFSEMKSQFAGLGKDLDGIKSKFGGFTTLFATLGATLSAGAFGVWVKGAINAADEMGKMSQKVGVSVEQLSALGYAGSLADVSLEQLGLGLKQLSKNMFAATLGGQEQKAAFSALLGENWKVILATKGTSDVFSLLANRFAGMADGSNKTALAMKLFGRSGADLIPLLNAGADGLREMKEEGVGLGVVLSTEMAKKAEEFNDNLTRVKQTTQGVAFDLANGLLPTVNDLALGFLSAKDAIAEHMDKIRAAVELTGAVFAATIGGRMVASLGVFLASLKKVYQYNIMVNGSLVATQATSVGLTSIMSGLSAVTARAGTAMAALFTTLGGLVTLIGVAAGAWMVYIRNKSQALDDKMSGKNDSVYWKLQADTSRLNDENRINGMTAEARSMDERAKATKQYSDQIAGLTKKISGMRNLQKSQGFDSKFYEDQIKALEQQRQVLRNERKILNTAFDRRDQAQAIADKNRQKEFQSEIPEVPTIKNFTAAAKQAKEDIAKAIAEIDDTIAKNTLEKSELELREIDKKAEAYRKLGLSKVDVERFVSSETSRVQKELDAETAKYRTEQMNKAAEMLKMNQQLREAEIEHQLSLVDTAEAYHDISKAAAADQRLALNRDLLAVQEKSLSTIDKAADPSAYIAQVNAIKGTIDKIRSSELAVRELSNDFGGGFAEGIRGMIQEASNLFQEGEQLARGFADSLRQAFDDGFFSLIIGKFEDLSKVLQSFFQNLARQISNILSQRATNSIISGIGSLFGGNAATASTPAWLKNAKGNAFASPSLSKYSGQVVTKPTMFKFAYGGIGQMGEGADAEGIFPLARDRSGKLGVRALGGNGNVTSNVEIHIDSSGNTTRTQSSAGMTPELATNLGRMIDNAVMDVLVKQKRAGGLLA